MSKYAGVAAQVKKILGAKANVPKDLPPACAKAEKQFETAAGKFAPIVKQLEAVILAMQDAASEAANANRQFGNKMAKEDFGLDTKDPDYKKNRDAAQKLLDAYFDGVQKTVKDKIKDLDELDKHLDDLQGYKSPPGIADS
jgi:hypothetical protein